MPRGRGMTRYPRLKPYDLHCLRVETPARPLQIGILAVLDGSALLDPAGRLRLADIRREIDGRLAGVPAMRRVVFRPGPLAGRPLWVDDPAFRIDPHVSEVRLPPPGDDAALLALTEQLMARPLDRSRPLWRMWFATGLTEGRVGALVVLHHAFADGVTALRMVRSLLEPPLSPAGNDQTDAYAAAAPPAWRALVHDNIASTIESSMRLARPATWRLITRVVRSMWRVTALARSSPRTSLNGPVGPRRRLEALKLEQAAIKRVARAHGVGVNDVVLSLVAGGVRSLLDARGEPIELLRPRAGVAVALFSAGHGREAGNDIGTLHVPLPIGEPDPGARLPVIGAARLKAKQSPMVAAEPFLRAWLGRFGVLRRSLEHQRLVSLATTYLPGPPVPIEVLGAPVLDLLPIAPLAGNLGLSFVSLSYAGCLRVTVRADADQFPDLDVLTAAMERDWRRLSGSVGFGGGSRPSPMQASAGSAPLSPRTRRSRPA